MYASETANASTIQKRRVRSKPPEEGVLGMERIASSSSIGSGRSGMISPAGGAGVVFDPLMSQEMAVFGITPAENPLPPPPDDRSNESLGSKEMNGMRRALQSTLNPAPPPEARAKRPKNIKFSPVKGGKSIARRSLTNATGSSKPAGPVDLDGMLPNNDYCDACGGGGHFLCCDGGCLRSFHFSCLDPPMNMDDLPEDSWFCRACQSAKNPPAKPPRGLFAHLVHKLDIENPKVFSLPQEIKTFYRHIATGLNGEFIDTMEHRVPSKSSGRATAPEDRDGFRLKDKLGRAILCYNCGKSASIPKRRKILSCDFCEQHWHLDCINPPMTGMPPPTRKYMCPLHTDHILPRKRLPKNSSTITVTKRDSSNNGDIMILPRREVGRTNDYEEVTVNRIRYQVPEETLILQFWGGTQGVEPKFRALNPTEHQAPQKLSISRDDDSETGTSISSPLTSLGDSSDADPPEATASADPDPRQVSVTPSWHQQYVPSALDELAMLAEGYFDYFIEQQESSSGKIVPATFSNNNAVSDEHLRVANSEASSTSLSPDELNLSVPSTENSALSRANGLVIKLPARNGPHRALRTNSSDVDVDRRSKRLSAIPTVTIKSEMTTFDKGKGKIDVEEDRRISTPLPIVTMMSSNGALRDSASEGFTSSNDFPGVPASTGSLSVPPRPVPPTTSPRWAATDNYSELAVQSREDLKALMRVRKMLNGGVENPIDQKTRSAVLQFVDGAAIVPRLAFLKPDGQRSPWELPWENSSEMLEYNVSPSPST